MHHIEGVAKQGERAKNRRTFVTKAWWRRCRSCGIKAPPIRQASYADAMFEKKHG
jgi:hypothetical protein